MLIKVTNRCGMGCSHCMENSTPAGEHMTEETFLEALEFTRRIEEVAWSIGCPPRVLLSGGECTEHPLIVRFVELAFAAGMIPMLISNGMWLADDALRESLLRPEWQQLHVQITNDPRFYPSQPPRVNDPRVIYVDSLTVFVELGRGKKGRSQGVSPRVAPASFNLRSLTRGTRDVRQAVAALRARAAVGLAGHCTPSVTHEGWVMAGETRNCFKLGTVASTADELTRALLEMGSCNACGLETGLSPHHRHAIGLG